MAIITTTTATSAAEEIRRRAGISEIGTAYPVEPAEEDIDEEEPMHEYKIVTYRTVWERYWVMATDEEDAREGFWNGEYDDSEEIESCDEEIDTVEEVDPNRNPINNPPQPHRPTILMNEDN